MWSSFLYQPFSPFSFGIYRIATGGIALLLCISLYPDLYTLLGDQGLVGWEISDALANPLQPTLGKFYAFSGKVFTKETFLYGFWWVYVCVLLLFTLGIRTLLSAFLAWLLHLTLMNTCRFGAYGVESILNIAFFYAIFFPCGQALAFDSKWQTGTPTAHARVSLRILQIQLCIIYVASGVEKAWGQEWWNGNAIWYSLTEEQFRQFDFSWMADHPWIPRCAGWWTLLIESGYGLMIWTKRPVARFWVANTLLLHAGIFVFMGLHAFALTMISLNVAAFGYLWKEHWTAMSQYAHAMAGAGRGGRNAGLPESCADSKGM